MTQDEIEQMLNYIRQAIEYILKKEEIEALVALVRIRAMLKRLK